MKIYTKTGDSGTTSLIGGERVSKCDLRVEAYGTVDELTAFIALLGDTLVEDERTVAYLKPLQRIESQLMTVAALFAVGKGGEGKVAPIAEERITELENEIDAMQATIPAITKFTIPGGHRAVSLCHVCRTVCRRAERASICASQEYDIDPSATIYLNRLSDYFYLLGRTITQMASVEEILWIP
jgi:cob(I)alamin adenosyltransferase